MSKNANNGIGEGLERAFCGLGHTLETRPFVMDDDRGFTRKLLRVHGTSAHPRVGQIE